MLFQEGTPKKPAASLKRSKWGFWGYQTYKNDVNIETYVPFYNIGIQ